jgi:ABC-type spermidine/putrescine transport system permease subunit II
MKKSVFPIRGFQLPWLEIISAFVLIFIFAPILIIVLFSFNDSPALSFPIRGFSFQWYITVLNSPQFRTALKNTIIVGFATSFIAMFFGTLAALGLTRYRFKLRPFISGLIAIPIALPVLFIGLALLSYFALIGMQLSLFTVVIGHVIYTLPYFALVANARLERFDMVLEEAAQDLGATNWQTFLRVTLPIIAPSVMGAGILVFALSFDEFLITFFVIGSESTLPMLIWSMIRRSLDPRVNVISTLVMLVSLILIIIMSKLVDLREISV